jgi:hypothetical protein
MKVIFFSALRERSVLRARLKAGFCAAFAPQFFAAPSYAFNKVWNTTHLHNWLFNVEQQLLRGAGSNLVFPHENVNRPASAATLE